MAILAYQFDQPLLAKFAVIIFRLGYSITVGNKHVAGEELYGRFRKT